MMVLTNFTMFFKIFVDENRQFQQLIISEMKEEKKKVSLFKQKMNESRQKVTKEQKGFPVAPRLVDPSQQVKESTQNHSLEEEKVLKEGSNIEGFLHTLNHSTAAKKEELDKIESQNWETINKMSQAERQKMVEELQASLPASFLSLIQKKTEEKSQKQQVPSASQQEQKEAQHENIFSQDLKQKLKLNLKDQTLQYTEKIEEYFSTIPNLQLAIESSIKQSQIVGSEVLKKWSKAIESMLTSKTRELLIVDGTPIHGVLVAKLLKKSIFLCFSQINSTSYSSSFMQISISLTKTILNLKSLFPKKDSVQITQKLSALVPKIKQFPFSEESASEIRNSLETLIDHFQQKEKEINWKYLLDSVDSIVELSLMEGQFEGYWFKAYESVSKCTDFDELLQILTFLFEFVNKLMIKRNNHPYIDIKSQRQLWTVSIDILIDKFSQSCWQIDSQYLFQSVFLARFVGGDSWEAIISVVSKLGEKGILVSGFILFNTLPDFKADSIETSHIESLNNVCDWLSVYLNKNEKMKINPNYILSIVLEMFFKEEEYYSVLNQEIIETLLKRLIKHPLITLDIITKEQINSLTKNYRFNSFGNKNFTFLLLSLCSITSREKQEVLLKQSVLPYWKYFYEVAEKLDENELKIKKNEFNRDLKDEILQKIKEEHGFVESSNMLIKWLKE